MVDRVEIRLGPARFCVKSDESMCASIPYKVGLVFPFASEALDVVAQGLLISASNCLLRRRHAAAADGLPCC